MRRPRLILSVVSVLVSFVPMPVFASAEADGDGGVYLSFGERVAGREKVEDILWSHRLWPESNPTPKPERWQVMDHDVVADTIEASLLYEAALLEIWGEELTTDRIQTELDRIARSTRRPEILLEIFAALDNDPLLVAECYVRPQLAERRIRQRHEQLMRRESTKHVVEADPAAPGFDLWWAGVRSDLTPTVRTSGAYTLPGVVKCRYCNDDNWSQAPNLPDFRMTSRARHSTVWTGTEMIVWGGDVGERTDTGGRYDPLTDWWTPISTDGAPQARSGHSAVWTGTEMIVWGGIGDDSNRLDTGGRYDPATDSWAAMTTSSAPPPRYNFPAVWTGSEMVVWGGYDSGELDTGGRYDPATDTWTPTATTDAPTARQNHTAVWTGSVMIVWGGEDSAGRTDTGARYDPATDTWTATTLVGVPDARYDHSAVWTGYDMIVWGGVASGYATGGGRYNPVDDIWLPVTATGEPPGRQDPSAVWTGSRMIVWGGGYDTGGVYNPGNNSWTPTTTTGAPAARALNSCVWTGAEMIIWGGSDLDDGARYDPVADSWTPMYSTSAPTGRYRHTAVWLGTEMIVWGGIERAGYTDTGAVYDLIADAWTPLTTTGAPSARAYHTAVWTGTEMIIWGGGYNTGGRYNPTTGVWTATSTAGAPTARGGNAAVWTGSEMLIWGGSYVNTGGKYDPATDTWTATTTLNAPPGLTGFAYVWADPILVVWGGQIPGQPGGTYANYGGRYNATADMWFATSTTGAPSARTGAQAVWTGTEMILWGGYTAHVPDLYPTVGGRYDPSFDTWVTMGDTGAPDGRYFHSMLWTGEEAVIWAGEDGDGLLDTGGRYDPVTNSWTLTNLDGAASPRKSHASVWTGSELLVWGGESDSSPYFLRDGGVYCASGVSDTTPPVNPTITGADPIYITWTSDDTVTMYWTGATDDASGVAGYSVLMDQNPSTIPDDTVEVDHVVGTNSVEMPAVGADGDDWYFHLKTCDNAGNCTATGVHGGPFWIDTTAPSAPGAVTSASHDGGAPTSDDTIDVAWVAATDATSGVARYNYDFTDSSTSPACSALVSTTAGTMATSTALADGTWYLHVCAEDEAGLTGGVATGGPYVVDTTPPTDPSALASTSHTPGTWSQTPVVAMQWSGATDPHGPAGYSIVFDTSAATQPDTVVDVPHTADPHSSSSGTLADGDAHHFHLSVCDDAGNCSAAAHAGPFMIDVTAPGSPGAVSSPSHGGGPSNDTTIDVVWGPATDATSLIDGYSFAFSAAPTWTCDTTKDVEEGTTSAASSPLGDGGWFFHICAVDNAGNWGPVTTGGPYVVEAVPPTVIHVGSVADSGDGAVTVDEEIDAPLTQLLLSFNEAMSNPAGHTTPGDVSNPSSYRLVGDGGDGVIATTTCAVDPSDTVLPIDDVGYDAGSAIARLYPNGGLALPVGSYALFACASEGLADLSGNLLDGDGNGTGGDDFAVAFSVIGTSLVANPNLDGDANGWTYDGPVTVDLTHSTDDADGAPSSGSLHLFGSALAHDEMSVRQCVGLSVPGSHRVGGRVRMTSSVPGVPLATVALTLYGDGACTAGNELNLGTSATLSGDTSGWADLHEITVWSGTALSALVVYTVSTDQAVDIDVNLDRLGLWLEDSPLSADGFEAGGTQNWTETQVGP